MRESETFKRLGKFTCPECRLEFNTAELLGEHLQVHDVPAVPAFDDPLARAADIEDSDNGRRVMAAIGRKGGRMARKWVCAEHGFTTGSGYAWSIHKKEYHGGTDPRDAEDIPTPARLRKRQGKNGHHPFADAIDALKVRRAHRMAKLAASDHQVAEIDQMIVKLEKLG